MQRGRVSVVIKMTTDTLLFCKNVCIRLDFINNSYPYCQKNIDIYQDRSCWLVPFCLISIEFMLSTLSLTISINL